LLGLQSHSLEELTPLKSCPKNFSSEGDEKTIRKKSAESTSQNQVKSNKKSLEVGRSLSRQRKGRKGRANGKEREEEKSRKW